MGSIANTFRRPHGKKKRKEKGKAHTGLYTCRKQWLHTQTHSCGIPGIAQNDLTAQKASNQRWAVPDKAGSCGGALLNLECVCVFLCGGDVMNVGAALSPAICRWHTNTEIPSDTGQLSVTRPHTQLSRRPTINTCWLHSNNQRRPTHPQRCWKEC